MSSQPSVPLLCKTIKTLVKKGDHATEKAEQFYIAAGKHLAELKLRCPTEWLQHAKEEIGIGRSRAYELVGIGTGERTVEQVREVTRQRVKHHRSGPSPLRNGPGLPSTGLRLVWFCDGCEEIHPHFVPPCDCCVPFVSTADGSVLRPIWVPAEHDKERV
jgi:hypothetical protein